MVPGMEDLISRFHRPHPSAAPPDLEIPFWVLQKRGYGLGNFLTMTPALQGLSIEKGKRIPVFFSDSKLGEIFKDSPYIQVLKSRPTNDPEIKTRRPSKIRKEDENDADCFYRHYVGDGERPPTYVDRPQPPKDFPPGPCVAVFHGCLNHNASKGKLLPEKTLQVLLNRVAKAGSTPVILGNKQDYDRFWKALKYPEGTFSMIGRPLRVQVGALAACDCFISNDTGLAHVAGALGVTGTILWRKSAFKRFALPYPGVTHFRDEEGRHEEYVKAIDRQLGQLKEELRNVVE